MITTRPPLARATPRDLRRLARRVAEELDRLTGKPTEGAVRGDLLIAFDREWPEGYRWPGDALWGDPEDGDDPLDPDRFYDLTDWELDPEDWDGQPLSLWKAFSDWHARQGREEA